mgnify:FL=1
MRTHHLLLFALAMGSALTTFAQDRIWIRYTDRFKDNGSISLENVDSIEVRSTQLRLYDTTQKTGYRNLATSSLLPVDAADMMFTDPGRILLKPNTYSGTDYTNDKATSGYNFAHSMESEHYAVFWDVRYGDNPARIKHPDRSEIANASDVLAIGERCWEKYVELGFLVPGTSTTDKYKIQLYIPYQSEWRADASGTDGASGGKTGIGHFNPWAATARSGHTVAHEVGHTFQFLVHADLGWNRGFDYGYGDNAAGYNGWWESCADWQAYKIFPERQFTDGEYLEQYMTQTHLAFMHQDFRYANCYFQDYWCMKHGTDFIGRLWRESIRPEDPIEAYIRICGLTLDEFADEQFEGCMRMATFDIDGVRDAAKAANKYGRFPTHYHLASGTTDTWEVDAAYCPQNFGYNIINMNNVAAGTEIQAHFHGIAGAEGYHAIRTECAGWRYGFVAMTRSGERVYGEAQRTADGTATLTVPENCQRIFFVVMGAPTEYWRHPWITWDGDTTTDEQWPYQVRFENINIAGK